MNTHHIIAETVSQAQEKLLNRLSAFFSNTVANNHVEILSVQPTGKYEYEVTWKWQNGTPPKPRPQDPYKPHTLEEQLEEIEENAN